MILDDDEQHNVKRPAAPRGAYQHAGLEGWWSSCHLDRSVSEIVASRIDPSTYLSLW